ncbi:MAG: hypothetical protein CMM83_05370 [Rhodospirillales bacterium]|nr:hypothetical protein [Rhodospirillales bacterium]|tara:strand:- start:731 stop:1117 length:387 start_codon:yes stop_codon:yes gene_type:complete
MTEKPKDAQEPSIEEILASIRKIISQNEGKDQKDSFELPESENNLGVNDNMHLGQNTGSLPEKIQEKVDLSETIKETDSDESMIGDLAKEIMRPMIKEWLDENLLELVERAVRDELDRLTRSAENKGP